MIREVRSPRMRRVPIVALVALDDVCRRFDSGVRSSRARRRYCARGPACTPRPSAPRGRFKGGGGGGGAPLETASSTRPCALCRCRSGEPLRLLCAGIGSSSQEGELLAVARLAGREFVVTGAGPASEWAKAKQPLLCSRPGRPAGPPDRRAAAGDDRLVWSPTALRGGRPCRRQRHRVLRTGDWHEVFADVDYAGAVYGLSFAGYGQLAAAGIRRRIRLMRGSAAGARVKGPGRRGSPIRSVLARCRVVAADTAIR